MVSIKYKDYTIHYGRNAPENWAILEGAEKEDLWFHLDEFPSAHVILEVHKDIQEIDKDVIEYCCKLCVKRTPKVNSVKVKVIYTEVRYLRKGKSVGEVCVDNKIGNVNEKYVYKD